MNDIYEREVVLGNLCLAVGLLEKSGAFARIIPEVRTNIVFALPDARTPSEVGAISGRITVINEFPKATGYPAFGASSHLARKILEVRKYDSSYYAAINFVHTPELEEFLTGYCKENDILYGAIDRMNEPEEVAKKEEGSMPWKVAEAVRSTGGKVPEIFYEAHAVGKEDLNVLIGKTAVDVTKKAIAIAEAFEKSTT